MLVDPDRGILLRRTELLVPISAENPDDTLATPHPTLKLNFNVLIILVDRRQRTEKSESHKVLSQGEYPRAPLIVFTLNILDPVFINPTENTPFTRFPVPFMNIVITSAVKACVMLITNWFTEIDMDLLFAVCVPTRHFMSVSDSQ
jgi:hypothetical protein